MEDHFSSKKKIGHDHDLSYHFVKEMCKNKSHDSDHDKRDLIIKRSCKKVEVTTKPEHDNDHRTIAFVDDSPASPPKFREEESSIFSSSSYGINSSTASISTCIGSGTTISSCASSTASSRCATDRLVSSCQEEKEEDDRCSNATTRTCSPWQTGAIPDEETDDHLQEVMDEGGTINMEQANSGGGDKEQVVADESRMMQGNDADESTKHGDDSGGATHSSSSVVAGSTGIPLRKVSFISNVSNPTLVRDASIPGTASSRPFARQVSCSSNKESLTISTDADDLQPSTNNTSRFASAVSVNDSPSSKLIRTDSKNNKRNSKEQSDDGPNTPQTPQWKGQAINTSFENDDGGGDENGAKRKDEEDKNGAKTNKDDDIIFNLEDLRRKSLCSPTNIPVPVVLPTVVVHESTTESDTEKTGSSSLLVRTKHVQAIPVEDEEDAANMVERASTWPMDVGYVLDQNTRRAMEDRVTVCNDLSFYGLYDGHGGIDTVDVIAANLHQYLLSRLPQRLEARFDDAKIMPELEADRLERALSCAPPSTTNNMSVETTVESKRRAMSLPSTSTTICKAEHEEDEEAHLWRTAFVESFEAMEAVVRAGAGLTIDPGAVASSGSCAVCCVLDKEKKRVHVGNLGDSRIVLCRKGRAIVLTSDHRPSLDPLVPVEKRVFKEGAQSPGYTTEDDRLPGGSSVSRAFGNYERLTDSNSTSSYEKADAMSHQVEYSSWQVETDDDEFLLIACDGVFDVCSNDEAVKLIRRALRAGKNPQDAAHKLVEHSKLRKSTDNISVVIVLFKAPPKLPSNTNSRLFAKNFLEQLKEEA